MATFGAGQERSPWRGVSLAMVRFPDPPTAAGSSPLRVHLTYWWRHRRFARLDTPLLFTEWVQHRKLNDRDPRFPALADKVLVKDVVADLLGREWITPTLWRGRALPAEPAWEFPYVVKARHGCQQTLVVRTPADHAEAVRQSREWMARDYGAWLDEWLYGEIERGLLVEPFIGEGEALPIDFKVFVFGGEARFVQVHLGRGADHRWIVFDTDWRRVSLATADADPPRPHSLPAMLRAAELLGEGFSFVRADFYEIGGQPRFGELTFYPGSGLERVEPPRLDLLMGLLWRSANERPIEAITKAANAA
ncbi:MULTISPECIES: ATP-grasp fold amidoligase family protein [Sphingomonas]|uniref:ATP-grasp fold amidoligase family protein n=1 Tax=Sphingomonas TaxID=13687 RepID=UPI001F085AEE|nr:MULTISPECIES: ATP-grasp fold amidoligase family protein [Sphingomonas]